MKPMPVWLFFPLLQPFLQEIRRKHMHVATQCSCRQKKKNLGGNQEAKRTTIIWVYLFYSIIHTIEKNVDTNRSNISSFKDVLCEKISCTLSTNIYIYSDIRSYLIGNLISTANPTVYCTAFYMHLYIELLRINITLSLLLSDLIDILYL